MPLVYLYFLTVSAFIRAARSSGILRPSTTLNSSLAWNSLIARLRTLLPLLASLSSSNAQFKSSISLISRIYLVFLRIHSLASRYSGTFISSSILIRRLPLASRWLSYLLIIESCSLSLESNPSLACLS